MSFRPFAIWRRRSALAAFVVLFATPLAAQQDASIIGQVTDESGAVLPGVTVNATSPALQVPAITVTTDERGEYRLTPLPIGTYTVEYSLSGFQIVKREGVRLTVGFVAKLDIPLKLGSIEETITVTGASPVVDVTSPSAVTRLTKENLEIIPTSRNGLIGLMVQAPGVRSNIDVGGSTMNDFARFRAFGLEHEAWTTLEGVVTTSPKGTVQGGGHYWDYFSIEEAKVQTFAGSAESPTRGVTINAILKSGSNDFHGSGFFAKTSHQFQSNNIDDALAAQGITSGNPIQTRSDLAGDLGGRIVRDKLWFYGGGRRRQEIANTLQCFQPDGSPCTASNVQVFSTEKLSYQMSPASRLLGFHQRSAKETISGASRLVSWESRRNQVLRSNTFKVEWQRAKGNVLMSVQYGSLAWSTEHTGYTPDKVSTRDLLTGVVTGQVSAAAQTAVEYRYQPRASVSWYKPDLLLGNHDFKAGFDFVRSRSDRPWVSREAAGNYELGFRNGVPFQIFAWNYPVTPYDFINYSAAYGQDAWTIARRLTLNLGIRYARDNAYAPEQCRVAADPPSHVVAPAQCFAKVQMKIFHAVVPRLYGSFDLTGDGKSVIKGGWGRYARMRYIEEVQQSNRNVSTTTTYRWNDRNGNRAYDSGEVDLSPNGPDFISTTVGGAAALANGVPNPDERQPMTDELSVVFEQEVATNLAVRVMGIYSRTMDTYRLLNLLRPYDVYNIPITNPDPGPDGRVGTPDDTGRSITYYDYPASLAGSAFQKPTLVNDPSGDARYKSFEVGADRRLSNRWQFSASFSATKKDIPLVPNVGGGTTILVSAFDPNAEIFSDDRTWEWISRVSGAYILPADVLLSTNFEHRSGEPRARQVSFTGGRQIPSITLNVEPLGTTRLPNINILDFSLEKRFSVFRRQTTSVRVNIFNSLNTNAITAMTTLSGPNYGRVTSIMLPRIVELSATHRF